MLIKLQDGKSTTGKVNKAIRGLRVKSVELQREDIGDLLDKHHEDIVTWVMTLRDCMKVPKPVYDYEPINNENLQKMLDGQSYICRATIRK